MDYQYCEVLANENLCEGVFRLTLQAPWLCGKAQPGHFVMLGQEGGPYLNRPFGIAGLDKEAGSISLLIKELGEGTANLSRVRKGSCLPVLGPLGKGFPLPEDNSKSLLVAGGMGIAPLLYLAANLQNFALVYGERSRRFLLTEGLEAEVHYATEDGSLGHKGYPTHLLPDLLEQGSFRRLYVCGPTDMMRSVAVLAAEHGLPCYVSLEERMGCGYGVCMGCVCGIKEGDTLKNLRVCKEGPVFLAEEVEWDG